MPNNRENKINHEMHRYFVSFFTKSLQTSISKGNYPSGMTRSDKYMAISSGPLLAGQTMVRSMTTIIPIIMVITDIYSHDIT